MPKRVLKDTYMYEQVAQAGQYDPLLVRREVFAGQFIPDHYVEGDDTESGAVETPKAGEGPRTFGFGAAPTDYKHNVGVDLKDQLAIRQNRRGAKGGTGKKEVAAASQGGAAAQGQVAPDGFDEPIDQPDQVGQGDQIAQDK